jgi:hypothetical protein
VEKDRMVAGGVLFLMIVRQWLLTMSVGRMTEMSTMYMTSEREGELALETIRRGCQKKETQLLGVWCLRSLFCLDRLVYFGKME